MERCADDLAFLQQRLADEEKSKPQAERSEMSLIEKLNFVLENNFKRVSYTEAIDILKASRSEEHTSELQSRPHLVCRLLLEKTTNFNAPPSLVHIRPIRITKSRDPYLDHAKQLTTLVIHYIPIQFNPNPLDIVPTSSLPVLP